MKMKSAKEMIAKLSHKPKIAKRKPKIRARRIIRISCVFWWKCISFGVLFNQNGKKIHTCKNEQRRDNKKSFICHALHTFRISLRMS